MRERNLAIQLIRIFAMFMIFTDHMLVFVDIPAKTVMIQITNSGVFIFLFISGFLLGTKKINNYKRWFFHRLSRLLIPLYLFVIVDFILERIFLNSFNWKYLLYYFFNVQGIFGANSTGNSLWFVTLIMICYFLTPAFQWIKGKNVTKKVAIIVVVLLFIVQAVLAYVTNIGMVSSHSLSWCLLAIGVYAIGYFVGPFILPEKIKIKRLFIVTILTFVGCLTVICLRQIFKNEIWYSKIVFYYIIILVDYWICLVVATISKLFSGKQIRKVINHIDRISYEFYIVHWAVIVFVNKALSEMNSANSVLQIMISIIAAYVCAVLLNKISDLVLKPLKILEGKM